MTQDAAGSAQGRCSQPVAWAALGEDGQIAWIGYTEEGAKDGAAWRTVVPLYRQPHPALTDEERTAIIWCVEMAETTATECDEEVATLRGLLERTR